MFSRLFPSTHPAALRAAPPSDAECLLIQETLLRASVNLLAHPEPEAAIEQMLERLTSVAPHMPLAWAWLGSASAELIASQGWWVLRERHCSRWLCRARS
jgi:hypothetical protein